MKLLMWLTESQRREAETDDSMQAAERKNKQ
jgi:hypothetical protein